MFLGKIVSFFATSAPTLYTDVGVVYVLYIIALPGKVIYDRIPLGELNRVMHTRRTFSVYWN